MHRYYTEYRLRRQSTTYILTLMDESVGERTGLDTLVVHAVNDGH